MNKIKTMQELLDALEQLGYSDSTCKQIRPRIKECQRVYNAPLHRIPADLEAFENRWGRGRVSTIAVGFRSQKHFLEWRKRVRAVLARAKEPTPGDSLLPEWRQLADHAAAIGGVGRPLGPHRHHSLLAVARPASADGIPPGDLVPAWVTPAAARFKGRERRSFKRGIATLNDLIALRAEHPEIDPLLPQQPLSQPQRGKRAPSSWRRGGRPEAARLWDEFDGFVRIKRGQDAFGRAIPVAHSRFDKSTERTYEAALRTAIGLLERAGDLDPAHPPGLAEICTPEVIARVANLWTARIHDGEVRNDSTTCRMMIARLIHIAKVYGNLDEDQHKKLEKINAHLKANGPRIDRMSPPRLEWIKAFSKSPAQQLAVHRMPELLKAEAEKLLDQWETLKRARRNKERMRALSLGIAAVQAAILFRGSAMRAGNLRGLTFRGPAAQIQLPEAAGDVAISIPAALVKNRVPIDIQADPSARPVIDWYLREIRPRLLDDHPYGCGLVDSDFLFPSTRADRPLEETTFATHYTNGAQAVGLNMTLHQARQVTGYFILSIDPSAIAQVAALLCNTPKVAADHYAWMDDERLSRESRALLQQAWRKACGDE